MADCFEGALIEFACETSKEIHGCSKRSWKGQMMPCKGWKSAWALLACVIVESHEGESCLLMRVREWDISIFCKFYEVFLLYLVLDIGWKCIFCIENDCLYWINVFLTMFFDDKRSTTESLIESLHASFTASFNLQCKFQIFNANFQSEIFLLI